MTPQMVTLVKAYRNGHITRGYFIDAYRYYQAAMTLYKRLQSFDVWR